MWTVFTRIFYGEDAKFYSYCHDGFSVSKTVWFLSVFCENWQLYRQFQFSIIWWKLHFLSVFLWKLLQFYGSTSLLCEEQLQMTPKTNCILRSFLNVLHKALAFAKHHKNHCSGAWFIFSLVIMLNTVLISFIWINK